MKNLDPDNQSGLVSYAAAALHQVLDQVQNQSVGKYQPGGGGTSPGGAPTAPGGLDINSMLSQTGYNGGFAPAPPVIPPPIAPVTPTTTPSIQVGPDGTLTINHVPVGTDSGRLGG